MVDSSGGKKSTVTCMLNAMREALHLNTDTELARVLNVTPQAISKARKTQKVPFRWVDYVKKMTGVDIVAVASSCNSVEPTMDSAEYGETTVGDRLKLIRGEMTQAQFALENKIPLSTYSRYERGEAAPDLWFIITLCKQRKISMEWLLLGWGTMILDDREDPPRQEAVDDASRLTQMENEFKIEREERRELAAENRRLWKENAALREENATLRERQRKEDQASLFDERKDSRRNDEPLQTRPFSRG